MVQRGYSSAVWLCVLCALWKPGRAEDLELILVNGIFRHGERTTYQFYPNDPHKNETFHPFGLGGLTNRGKMGEYQLGRFLRREYDKFLGPYYTEGLVDMRSTDKLRTQMSAQLVLAGLFPPIGKQIWNSDLLWQPIPIMSKPEKDEDIFHPDCKRKQHIKKHLPDKHDVQELFIKPHQKLFTFIEENSGMQIRNVFDVLEFYFIVNTEDDFNLTLPEWVRSIYPEPLYSTAAHTYAYLNHDEEARLINAGYMLKKMLSDIVYKINSTASHSNVKMFLYSGHETSVAFMMNGLNVLKPHIPPYGSILLFEVYKNAKNEHFIKLRYKMGSAQTKDITLPHCSTLCPLEEFINLQAKLIPSKKIIEACSM